MISKILGWAGFKTWWFWLVAVAGAAFLALTVQNAFLGSELKSARLERAAVEKSLDQALDKNEELVTAVARLQVGRFVDEGIVLQNQAEIDRLRRENNERKEQVAKQNSGPASDAIVCAITRVCDN